MESGYNILCRDPDIFFQIMSHTEYRTIFNVIRTSKSVKELLTEHFWKNVLEKNYSDLLPLMKPRNLKSFGEVYLVATKSIHASNLVIGSISENVTYTLDFHGSDIELVYPCLPKNTQDYLQTHGIGNKQGRIKTFRLCYRILRGKFGIKYTFVGYGNVCSRLERPSTEEATKYLTHILCLCDPSNVKRETQSDVLHHVTRKAV